MIPLCQLEKWLKSLLMLGMSGGCEGLGQPAPPPSSTAQYTQVKIDGDDVKNGVADVSVEYGDDGVGWLAYSVISVPQLVETHLAKSLDHGQSWSYVATVNRAAAVTQRIGAREVAGMWRHETPSLVYDPTDAGRPWKLFWHKYFVKPPYRDGDRVFSQGWIAYRYADRPDGKWSEEILLFGSSDFPGKVDVTSQDSQLANVKFFMEPGAMEHNGVIYMSLDTNTTASGLGDWRKRRIILVASLDHGESWRYVGTLTTGEDAQHLGYAALTASALVRERGRLFLMASPAGSRSSRNKGHDGTMIFEFADLTQAALVRDPTGHLVPVAHLARQFDMGGPSDYHEANTRGGILMPQIRISAVPDLFQVWATHRGILEAAEKELP